MSDASISGTDMKGEVYRVSCTCFAHAWHVRVNQRSECADLVRMEPIVILATLGGAFVAGVLTLGIMAARIDNVQRFADLIRETRRLRAAHQVASTPPRRRR